MVHGDAGPASRAAELGALIRRRREARGISLRAFARRCGLSPAHVSKIERGLVSPSIAALTTIVQELDLQSADLFGATPPADGVLVRRADEVPEIPGGDGWTGGVRVLARTPSLMLAAVDGAPAASAVSTVGARDVVLLVLDGRIAVGVAGDEHELAAGDAIVVPPETPFVVRHVEAGSRHLYVGDPRPAICADGAGA